MRALFREYAPNLKDGSYVFVAKVSINEIDHDKFQKDFKKVINRLKVIKEVM